MSETLEKKEISEERVDDVKPEFHEERTELGREMLEKSKFGVYYLENPSIEIDFGNSRGGVVNIVGTQKRPSEDFKRYELIDKKFQTQNIVLPQKQGDDMTLTIEGKNRMNIYRTMSFSRDTLPLIQSSVVRDSVKLFFEANPNENEVLFLHGFYNVLCPVPKTILPVLNGNALKDLTQSEKEKYEKEDLKVYETPSKLLSPMLKVIDNRAFKRYVSDKVTAKIRSIIINNTKLKNSVNEIFGLGEKLDTNITDGLDYAYHKIYKSCGDTFIGEAFDEDITPQRAKSFAKFEKMINESPRLKDTTAFVEKIYREGMDGKGFMGQLADNEVKEKWKEVFGFSPQVNNFVIFDPQAGSGEGLLKAMDETGFNGTLKGLELREDIKTEDPRAHIVGGVNTSLFAPVIEETFYNKQIKTSVECLFSYINPPYTSEDSVAKETIRMYKNDMVISGLFPTKMKNFLSNNLSRNSLIIEIPKSLSGYEDPKVPERLLFILGTKRSIEAHTKEHGKGALMDFKTGSPKFFSMKDDATPELFERVLHNQIEGHFWYFDNFISKSFNYYGESEIRSQTFFSNLSKNIGDNKIIFENMDLINEKVELHEKDIYDAFMPIEFAKKQKMFIDPRFYSKDSFYDRYGFDDVFQNIPLLVYYRDNMPQVLKIIEEIAKDKKLELPIDTSASSKDFILGEKYDGEKVPVTNTNLGMMKMNFYPSSISIKSERSKDILFSIIEGMYPDMSSEDREILRHDIEISYKLVIKSEKIVMSDEVSTQFMPKEVLVLLDPYGTDCGKLNIELDDFYSELEKRKLFSIHDYVNVVKINSDWKRKVLEGFIRDFDSSIYEVADFNGLDFDEFKKTVSTIGIDMIMKLNRRELESSDINDEVMKFSSKYRLLDMFKRYYEIDEEGLKSRLKTATKTSLSGLNMKRCETLSGQIYDFFTDNPILFFEESMLSTLSLESLSGILDSFYEDKSRMEQDINEFQDVISGILSDYYQVYNNITLSYSRFAETMIYRYPLIKETYQKDMNDDKVDQIYDNFFRSMMKNTLKLYEHQISEAEAFIAISDKKRVENLFLEMRTGKTLTFIAISYMLGLVYNKDVSIVLETANIPDISGQMLNHFPFLAMNAMYFGDGSKMPVSNKHVFSNLIHDKIMPVPYRIITQSKITGGGTEVQKLNKNFSKDIEGIRNALNEKYDGEITREKLLEDYPDSKFTELLTFTCG